ncbi:hypothetical protein CLOM_g14912 [Closterium sp. NIES-68]|nr:hypothetical protein CLOM_g14912 [Closterium sp. NIES-68]GJP75524.1 hypothetical protein CLOP_g5959 [Closterium sp. NIES-67]
MASCISLRTATGVSPLALVQDAKSTFQRNAVALTARPSGLRQKMTASRLQIVAMAGHAGGVEPDLSEESRAAWLTAGEESQQDNTFKYGKVDGAHAYHDGDDGEFWSNVEASLKEAGGPVSTEQKGLAWAFLPAFFAGVAFGLPSEYYIGFTVLFVFAYCGIEMGKPSKPTHFEPDMYKIK